MVPSQATQPNSLSVTEPLGNLPRQLTSFIGRKRSLADLTTLLVSHKLVTLTGVGGMGKTRIALEVAAQTRDQYVDGVWFVDLAPLIDPALVTQAINVVFALQPSAESSGLQILCDYLQGRHALLLLDNCESALAPAAAVAATLLQTCPNLTILATSRQALGVAGERVLHIPPLALPQLGAILPANDLLQYEAINLLVERARYKRYDFALNEANAQAAVDLCRRLDGIPLAIELAAARAAVLSLPEILRRLDERFRLLTTGDSSKPLRQQTLRALLDWSYNLLNEDERSLLHGVAVFAGSFALDAIRVVAAPDKDEFELIDLLGQLVDKSLLLAVADGAGTRYNLLETIREYARDAGATTGAATELGRRHCAYYLALAEEAEPQLQGTAQVAWLDRLTAEIDNLRAALSWSIANGAAENACRLSGALWRFWYVRGHFEEARRWFDQALALPGDVAVEVRAKALNGAGVIAMLQADFGQARRWLEAALRINQQRGDKVGIAGALNNLGMLFNDQRDLTNAELYFEQSLILRREIGELKALAAALNNLGTLFAEQGKFAAAREPLEEALSIRRRLQDKWGIALLLSNIGNLAFDSKDLVAARLAYEESLALRQDLGDRLGTALCLDNLGRLAREQQNITGAMELYRQSLLLHEQIGGRLGSAKVLLGIGVIAARNGDYQRAAHLLGQAEALHDNVGAPFSNWEQDDANEILQLRDAQRAMEPRQFALERALGRALTTQQTLEIALAPLVARVTKLHSTPQPPESLKDGLPSSSPTASEAGADHLTAREKEILRLIAAGSNNAQMAAQLSLSQHTIQAHVRSLYNKLGLASRSAATRYAIEHNLI